MNVEIGAEASQFPEKEYINGIAVAVRIAKLIVVVEVERNFCQWGLAEGLRVR
jgi:hypothetical protein